MSNPAAPAQEMNLDQLIESLRGSERIDGLQDKYNAAATPKPNSTPEESKARQEKLNDAFNLMYHHTFSRSVSGAEPSEIQGIVATMRDAEANIRLPAEDGQGFASEAPTPEAAARSAGAAFLKSKQPAARASTENPDAPDQAKSIESGEEKSETSDKKYESFADALNNALSKQDSSLSDDEAKMLQLEAKLAEREKLSQDQIKDMEAELKTLKSKAPNTPLSLQTAKPETSSPEDEAAKKAREERERAEEEARRRGVNETIGTVAGGATLTTGTAMLIAAMFTGGLGLVPFAVVALAAHILKNKERFGNAFTDKHYEEMDRIMKANEEKAEEAKKQAAQSTEEPFAKAERLTQKADEELRKEGKGHILDANIATANREQTVREVAAALMNAGAAGSDSQNGKPDGPSPQPQPNPTQVAR